VAIGKRWRHDSSDVPGLILLILAPFVGVKLSVLTVLTMIPLAAVLAFGLSSFGVPWHRR